jgi:hypothetical protein
MISSKDKSFVQNMEPSLSSGILSRRQRTRVLTASPPSTCLANQLQVSKQWNSDPFGFGAYEEYLGDDANHYKYQRGTLQDL